MKKIKTTFLLILLISIFSVGSVKASDVNLEDPITVSVFTLINNQKNTSDKVNFSYVVDNTDRRVVASCIDPYRNFRAGKYTLYDSLSPKDSAIIAGLYNYDSLSYKERAFAALVYTAVANKNNYYIMSSDGTKVSLKRLLTYFYNTDTTSYNNEVNYNKSNEYYIRLIGMDADKVKNAIKDLMAKRIVNTNKSYPTIEKYSSGTKYNESEKTYTVALKINNLDYIRELYALNNSGQNKQFNTAIFTNKDAYKFGGSFSKDNLKGIRYDDKNDVVYFDFNSNVSCMAGSITMGIGFEFETGLIYKVSSNNRQTFLAYANPFKGTYYFNCSDVVTYNICDVVKVNSKDECLKWKKKIVTNNKGNFNTGYTCEEWNYASSKESYTLYNGKDLVSRSFVENQGMPFKLYIFAPEEEKGANCCANFDNDPMFKEALKYFGLTDAEIAEGYEHYCTGNPKTICQYNPSSSSVNNSLLTTPYVGPTQFKTAEYAFTKLGCCDDYKNKINGFASVFNNSDWKEAYDKYCNGTPPENPNCVDPAPTKGTSKISNCCMDDTHSYIAEIQVTDLFKEDANKYGVTGTELKEKCDNSKLEVSKEDVNDYCELYCTERIEVDVPGAITADSGRYFKLNTVEGTEFRSPVIDGYRRCRVVVKYDKFESDYKAKVTELVNQYNEYQYNKMVYENYKNSKHSSSGSDDEYGSCGGSNCKADGSGCTKSHSVVKYDIYTVSGGSAPQLKVSAGNNGSTVSIVSDSNRTYGGESYSANVNRESRSPESCSTPGESGSSANIPGGSKENDYKNAMDTAKSNYDNLLNEIKKMEEKLNKCDNYFAETNYKLEPTMSFVYTQFYMDESGNPQSVDNVVNFNTSCENSTLITDPTKADSKDKIVGVGYATNTYGKSQTFNRLDENMNRTTYTADTRFRHDGIFNVKCHGEEEDKSYYTLIPSGSVSTVEEASNFTIHEREYKLLLTSYDGSYETHWDISGLGQKDDKNPEGRLNNFFNKPNEYIGYDTTITSCADKNADEEGTYTCVFNVTHKMITTGRCNPDSGLVTTNPDSCDPMREGYSLFYFKVVDPANLFPDGTSEYGKNWSNDMINKVQSTDTYNPNNITYQFTLNPADMKNIKEYNDSKESIGGYSDFDLKCTCDKTACTSCMSEFINNIYNGYINVNGNEKSISKPENDINSVRSKMEW